ncbi:hypothetical protein [Hyphomicrobium sp. 99]|uniref:hypothetical protein n=1 Tax=Hyphomicrobium sp. 99 TaxID=1163419 RepID=UPI0012E06BE5|nr:hypothetical protein [Hyphomicrobium sp. 99]
MSAFSAKLPSATAVFAEIADIQRSIANTSHVGSWRVSCSSVSGRCWFAAMGQKRTSVRPSRDRKGVIYCPQIAKLVGRHFAANGVNNLRRTPDEAFPRYLTGDVALGAVSLGNTARASATNTARSLSQKFPPSTNRLAIIINVHQEFNMTDTRFIGRVYVATVRVMTEENAHEH